MALPYKVRGFGPFDQLSEQIRRNLGILPKPDFKMQVEQDENPENDPNWQGPRDLSPIGKIVTKAFPPEKPREDRQMFGLKPNYLVDKASNLPEGGRGYPTRRLGGMLASAGEQATEFAGQPESVLGGLVTKRLLRSRPDNPNISYGASGRPVGRGATFTEPPRLNDVSELRPSTELQRAPEHATSQDVAPITKAINPRLFAGDRTTGNFTEGSGGLSDIAAGITNPHKVEKPHIAQAKSIINEIKRNGGTIEDAARHILDNKPDVVDNLTSKEWEQLSKEDHPSEPQYMKVPGVVGKSGQENIAMGGASSRVLDVLGSSLYSRSRPLVVAKELLQNSFDEHRIIGQTKPIKVAVDHAAKHPVTGEKNTALIVKDFGRGLTPDELYTKFTNVGETGKAGIESASGGFGFAKAAPMLSGTYAHIESVVDEGGKRIKYEFAGTPTELKNQTKGVPLTKVEVPQDTPTGLTVKTYFPENQPIYNVKSAVANIVRNSPSITSDVHFGENYSNSPDDLNDFFHETNAWPGYMREHATDIYTKGPSHPIQDTINVPGSKINIHYEDDPKDTADQYSLHFLNKGMYQDTTERGYGMNLDNVPRNITADIFANVEEGHDDYPFTANREQLNTKLTSAVQKWVDENVASGALKKRAERLKQLYQSLNTFPVTGTTRNGIFYDPGERLEPQELNYFRASPTAKALIRHFDSVVEDVLDSRDSQKAGSTDKWGERLEGIGLLLGEPSTLGIHIPNPESSGKSSILINPFSPMTHQEPKQAALTSIITLLHEAAHISNDNQGGFSHKDVAEIDHPEIGKFLQEYLKELDQQGGLNAGHGIGFLKRLAEVFSRFGPEKTFEAADKLHGQITDQHGGYSADVQELLRIYEESRGRDETTADFLSSTGVKSETPPSRRKSVRSTPKRYGSGVPAVQPIAERRLDKVAPISAITPRAVRDLDYEKLWNNPDEKSYSDALNRHIKSISEELDPAVIKDNYNNWDVEHQWTKVHGTPDDVETAGTLRDEALDRLRRYYRSSAKSKK